MVDDDGLHISSMFAMGINGGRRISVSQPVILQRRESKRALFPISFSPFLSVLHENNILLLDKYQLEKGVFGFSASQADTYVNFFRIRPKNQIEY